MKYSKTISYMRNGKQISYTRNYNTKYGRNIRIIKNKKTGKSYAYREYKVNGKIVRRRIKNVIKDGKLTPEFKDLLNDLEARLEKAKQNTKLPEKSNFNQLNKLVMDINECIIKGTVKQFKEPLKQLQIF